MDTKTIEELAAENTSGSFPILVDIQHDEIMWGDNLLSSRRYENGHLRLINDTQSVMYKGKYYQSSRFVFSPPPEDNKGTGTASITISAIDKSILYIIASISSKPRAVISTVFEKIGNGEIQFTPINSIVFEMSSASVDKINAKWNLTREPLFSLVVPRDKATANRCPGATEEN